jgi:hypothetical protein
MMKRAITGLALVIGTAAFGSAQAAVCVYADRQYSEGATICISPTATQTCSNNGTWTKLAQLAQLVGSFCDFA